MGQVDGLIAKNKSSLHGENLKALIVNFLFILPQSRHEIFSKNKILTEGKSYLSKANLNAFKQRSLPSFKSTIGFG